MKHTIGFFIDKKIQHLTPFLPCFDTAGACGTMPAYKLGAQTVWDNVETLAKPPAANPLIWKTHAESDKGVFPSN